jgi:hypothetical protein
MIFRQVATHERRQTTRKTPRQHGMGLSTTLFTIPTVHSACLVQSIEYRRFIISLDEIECEQNQFPPAIPADLHAAL